MSDTPAVERQKVQGPAGMERLGFAIDVPAGMVRIEFPGVAVDFDDPAQAAPLALWSSPETGAVLAVAARPGFNEGGVLQWVRRLAEHFKMDLQHVLVREVGSPPTHPGVTAFGAQRREGKKLSFMLAAFEDGGWLVTAHGACPADNWSACGNRLSEAVESIVLTTRRGGRFKVDEPLPERWGKPQRSNWQEDYERGVAERSQRRAPAMARVRELIALGRYDEADRALEGAEPSIEADVEVSRLYESRLREVVAGGVAGSERAAVESLYRRALSWAQRCYPEPHTQVEADDYDSGRSEDRARLSRVLGYDPDAQGGAGR
jgi:hypothetical protein